MSKMINYTKAQESEIRELSPISYDVAEVLAEKFGKKLRSVIAKACSLDGVVYVARERVAKNGSAIEKKLKWWNPSPNLYQLMRICQVWKKLPNLRLTL